MKNNIKSNIFVRNSLLLVTIEIVAKGLGVVFFVMLARFLGPNELGIFAFSIAAATFIVLPSKFGFEPIIQRDIGRDPSITYKYFCEIIAIKIMISLILWGIFLLILKWFFLDKFWIMALAAGFALLYSFMEFINTFFRANQRPEMELIVRTLFSIGNLAFGAIVLYYGGGLLEVLTTQLIAVTIALAVGVLTLIHISTKVRLAWNRKALWMYVVNATPFAAILLALYLSNQIGILILTPWSGTEDVGYFAAAMRLSDNISLIPAAIMGAFLPLMSGFYIKSVGNFVRTLRFTVKYMFILSVPFVLITGILARPIIIFLYKESFAQSVAALQILSLVIFFSFWNYTSESVLIARNREVTLLKLTWLTAVIHVAGNLLLIPLFSYLGACLAILSTQIIYSISLFFFQMRRYLNIVKLIKIIARPVVCASITAAVVFLLKNQNLLLSIMGCLLTYPITLFAFGAINRSELVLIYSSITQSKISNSSQLLHPKGSSLKQDA